MVHEISKATGQLAVMETFYSIQGEGFFQGKAAFFIRLAGCDVGCSWCDVKQSWDGSAHPLKSSAQIVDQAKSYPGRLAVVTGGEPLMQDCSELTESLRQAGFSTNIETSGAYPLSGEWDWICVSPKKFKPPLPEILPLADELKVVIYNKTDFLWAEKYASQVSGACKLFLQPEWGKFQTVSPLITEYIAGHPQWEFSLQLHKFIHVP
jgi:7-carboxy-7-deazaguanine synthase